MKIAKLALVKLGPFVDEHVEFSDGYNVVTGANASGKSLVLLATYEVLRCSVERSYQPSLGRYISGSTGSASVYLAEEENTLRQVTPVGRRASHAVRLVAIDRGGKRELTQQDERVARELGESFGLLFPNPTARHGPVVYVSSARGTQLEDQQHQADAASWRGLPTGARFAKLRGLLDLVVNQGGDAVDELNSVLAEFFGEGEAGPCVSVRKTRRDPSGQLIQTDVATLGSKHELAASAAGSAEILFLVMETIWVKRGIILIDEPELHLHPAWQAKVARYLHHLTTKAGGENQVIIGTHSLPMVYTPEVGRVIGLRRGSEGTKAVVMIDEGTPTEHYDEVVKELGYAKDALMGALTFHKKHKKDEAMLGLRVISLPQDSARSDRPD